MVALVVELEEQVGNRVDEQIGADGERVAYRVERHALVLAARQLRYERQVVDLSGRPAELKDGHKAAVVEEARPVRSVFACDAQVEDEWKAAQNAHNADQMPRLAAAVVEQAVLGAVRLEADEYGGHRVCHLT